MRWGEQPLSVTGEWWIDDPVDAVPGFLEGVPGRGLVLTVLGNMSEPFPRKPIPEVFGSAFSGVVLTGVAMVAGQRTGSEVQRQEFAVESALLGTHSSPSSLSIAAGTVRFTGMQSWRPGSEFRWGHEGSDILTATFRRPPVESGAVSGGNVSLAVNDRTHHGIGKVSIEAIPSFHIELDEPSGYNEFLSEWIAPLRDLNSLVTSHGSAIVDLQVFLADHDGPPIEVRGDPVESDSKVRPPALTALDLDLMRPPEWPGVDFPPPAGIRFQEILDNWWFLYGRQRLALEMYSSSYYSSPAPPSVRLLNHLVVLETFHQHKVPDAVSEPWDKFNERKKRILDPERWKERNDDRKWLKGRSWNLMNSLSLKSRLLALAELTSALDEVVTDWDQCCQQLADTRNYLAHGLARLEDRAIPPSEYEPVIRLLDSWIRGLIWAELGFNESLIPGMLRRVESFAELRASINQPWISPLSDSSL